MVMKEILSSFQAPPDSEFDSCTKGTKVEVIEELSDSSVIIKTPKGTRRIVPAFVFSYDVRNILLLLLSYPPTHPPTHPQ